jgi:protein bicaudal D
MPESTSEIAKLQQQLVELNQSLEDAIRERTQAAQYGLQVLEEKQQLEFKCQEIEATCDTLRHDYEAAKEVSFIATHLQLTRVHF